MTSAAAIGEGGRRRPQIGTAQAPRSTQHIPSHKYPRREGVGGRWEDVQGKESEDTLVEMHEQKDLPLLRGGVIIKGSLRLMLTT